MNETGRKQRVSLTLLQGNNTELRSEDIYYTLGRMFLIGQTYETYEKYFLLFLAPKT